MLRNENTPAELDEIIEAHIFGAEFGDGYGFYSGRSDICVLPELGQAHRVFEPHPLTIFGSTGKLEAVPYNQRRVLMSSGSLTTQEAMVVSKYGGESLIDSQGLFPDGYFKEEIL